MTTEVDKEIRASQDFDELERLVQDLVGKTCLRADFCYGGELELHFGDEIAYRHPKLAHKTRGSWVLEAFITPWAYFSEGEPRTSYFFGFAWQAAKGMSRVPEEEVAAALASLSGTRVERADVSARTDLTLAFSNGTLLQVFSRAAEPDPDLPAWELLTPHGNFLQVWGDPLPTWSLLHSDVPQST
jgi:hypothetical protein